MFDKILIACSVGGGEIACRIIEMPDMKKMLKNNCGNHAHWIKE